jgi:hypothetical protein
MSSFTSPEEAALSEEFLRVGYVIRPAEDPEALRSILEAVRLAAARHVGGPLPELSEVRIPAADLNAVKLDIMQALSEPWVRPAYYRLARSLLDRLVGNELAMQRRLNLSVQLPGDDRNLLPIHRDTDTGDSVFEAVLWVPLTDCARTASMWFRDHFIEIRYGEVLLFNQDIPHGNVVNEEPRSRWSLNCRFKGVWTPYAGKKLGEFFEPITLKAASRMGLR